MFRDRKKNLVYVLILLVPFVLFFSRSKLFNSLKFKFIELSSGPMKIISFPLKEIKKMAYYHRTFDEYMRLRKETDVLKARLIGMDEVILENTRLEKLLDFKRKLIYSSIAANVIGRDPSRWNASMIIDKGEKDGIELGQSVVNAYGVLGKIAEVGESTSKIILLTDPQFSVAAMVQGPRESGLITGTLQGLCYLKFLNEDAKVEVGDKVVTSKLSSSFPEGLLIGEVIRVEEASNNNSPRCIIKPAVALSQIEEVLVIQM